MYGITEMKFFKPFVLTTILYQHVFVLFSAEDNLFLQCENIQNFFIETVVRQMFQSLISGKFLWKDFV